MTCLACGTRALRSLLLITEAVRSGDVYARNVRYSNTEGSRRPVHIASLAPRKQPASSNEGNTFRRPHAQAPRCHNALFSTGTSGRREEPSHRARSVLTMGVDQTVTKPGKIATISRSRRNFRKREGRSKLERCPKNGASVDQDLLISYATYLLGGGSMHIERPGSPKIAGFGNKTQIRNYSSRRSEKSEGAMISAQSAKVSADSKIGTQRYKNQREPWQIQKKALADKFGSTGWLPRKRLSPDTLEGIRALHTQYPDRFTTPVLADQFKVSPEAIRRILKSKWRPNDEEEERRRRRWEKRGENIWSQMAEMGIKPPKKWRIMGVGKSTQRQQARSIQQSLKTTLPAQPAADSHTTSATGHKTHSPMLLADRIL